MPDMSWEEAVASFLEGNPEVFHKHPGLLSQLDSPHATRGHAVSRIERQVQILRDSQLSLRTNLNDLVEIARLNESLGERVHQFALGLFDTTSLDDVFEATYHAMRHEFQVDVCSARIGARPAVEAAGRPEFVDDDDRRFSELQKKVGRARTVCENRIDKVLHTYLFGRLEEPVKSYALIALGRNARLGFLALGARDPERFRPDMGTVYLVRMGDLVAAALGRHLR